MVYKVKYRKGIDDLKSLYAFHGNSQGDESQTNDIQTFLDSKGWMSFIFDCEMTEGAILQQAMENHLWNNLYIQELKAKGEYGIEDDYSIHVQHNPLFDVPKPLISSFPLESFKLIFLDEYGSWGNKP